MTTQFDVKAYRQRLVDGGIDAETAEAIAQNAAQQGLAAPMEQGALNLQASAEKPPIVLSARDKALIEAGLQIKDQPPTGDDMTFMHSIMCQVGLPRSKPNGLEFERICGGAGLFIRAGKLWDGKGFVQQPVPYGAMPRLIMAYVNTSAIRTQSPTVEVGNSASEFLRRLGKSANGGERGAFTTFRQQTQALAACSMTIGFSQGDRAFTYDGKPIKQFEAWLSHDENQPALWPGSVTLSDEYYRTLSEHAVPLDLRALMALKGSALAMDVYAFLAERLHRLGPRPLILHWKSLRTQFGQEFQGKEADKDFKKKFLPAMKKVLEVYPEARVRTVTGGLMLMSSPPPIPYRSM
jgi:hypothetical protein